MVTQSKTKCKAVVKKVKDDVEVSMNLEVKIDVRKILEWASNEHSLLAGFLDSQIDYYISDYNIEGEDGVESLTLYVGTVPFDNDEDCEE